MSHAIDPESSRVVDKRSMASLGLKSNVSQTDVARTIRAVIAAGLTVTRVITRPDGVAIETNAGEQPVTLTPTEPKRKWAV